MLLVVLVVLGARSTPRGSSRAAGRGGLLLQRGWIRVRGKCFKLRGCRSSRQPQECVTSRNISAVRVSQGADRTTRRMFQVAECRSSRRQHWQECVTTRNTSAVRVERIVLIGTALSLATATSTSSGTANTSKASSSRFSFSRFRLARRMFQVAEVTVSLNLK